MAVVSSRTRISDVKEAGNDMRDSLTSLNQKQFDVAILGAGVNGCSAAQNLAAAGYSVLIVDKNDFGSGSSSRSTRMLHCGLRYLAPGSSVWEFARHPGRFYTALSMARQAMESRAQFVTETPERCVPVKWFYPIYKDGPYAAWQVKLAFNLLQAVGSSKVPLDHRRISANEAVKNPLIKWVRDPAKLDGVIAFREYLYEWPERICVDTVLDAERLGATIRNYTNVERLEKSERKWLVTLRDTVSPFEGATVGAKVVLNTGGIWIDEINGKASDKAKPKRRITGTKGVHIMFQLPRECQGYALTVMNRLNEPINFVPWRGMHYFGPTETLYEDDIDDIKPLETEINWLIDEANFLLPGMPQLKKKDVIFSWAGVRPLTYNPALPKGNRSREVHDLAADGMENVFALTAGPIMTHRSAGLELTRVVRQRIEPSSSPKKLSFQAAQYPDNQNSPRLLDEGSSVTLADLRYAAEREHPTNLVDILFRRVGVGWTKTMGVDAARRAAETVAAVLGWDEERIADEAEQYRLYLEKSFHLHDVGR